MKDPLFTLVYNLTTTDGYLSLVHEFYTDEDKADARVSWLANERKMLLDTGFPNKHMLNALPSNVIKRKFEEHDRRYILAHVADL